MEIFNDKILDLLTGQPVTLLRVGQGEGADAWRREQGLTLLLEGGGGEGNNSSSNSNAKYRMNASKREVS